MRINGLVLGAVVGTVLTSLSHLADTHSEHVLVERHLHNYVPVAHNLNFLGQDNLQASADLCHGDLRHE